MIRPVPRWCPLEAHGLWTIKKPLRSGGGYAGIHAAADTEYDRAFYGGLVGAYFESHPWWPMRATVHVEDRAHPATADLPTTWNRTDEWYNFRSNPRERVRVLASLDESSYWGGTMNGDHPIAWCQNYRGGRSFYTGVGHSKESFAEPAVPQHLLGGIQSATGAVSSSWRVTPSTPWRGSISANVCGSSVASRGRVEPAGAIGRASAGTAQTAGVRGWRPVKLSGPRGPGTAG